jgi:hypothetical protein
MLKRYRKDAPQHAAARGDKLIANGDLDGQRVWKHAKDHAETVSMQPSPLRKRASGLNLQYVALPARPANSDIRDPVDQRLEAGALARM